MNGHAILALLCAGTVALSFVGSDLPTKKLKVQTPQQGLNALLHPFIGKVTKKPNETPRPCPRSNVANLRNK
jgi:hypothetical protein